MVAVDTEGVAEETFSTQQMLVLTALSIIGSYLDTVTHCFAECELVAAVSGAPDEVREALVTIQEPFLAFIEQCELWGAANGLGDEAADVPDPEESPLDEVD